MAENGNITIPWDVRPCIVVPDHTAALPVRQQFFWLRHGIETKKCTCVYVLYRAFHNVLRDYKRLKQENQRTYLNGTVRATGKLKRFFFFW